MSCIVCQLVDISKDSSFLCEKCVRHQKNMPAPIEWTYMLSGPPKVLTEVVSAFSKKDASLKIPKDIHIFEIQKTWQGEELTTYHAQINFSSASNCNDLVRSIEAKGIRCYECIHGLVE